MTETTQGIDSHRKVTQSDRWRLSVAPMLDGAYFIGKQAPVHHFCHTAPAAYIRAFEALASS